MRPLIKRQSEDDLSTEKKVNIFCPKCKSEVEHTAKGIQQDQIKSIILKVYHYFEQEYKELKKAFKALDLTPLSRFRERVALATGVSETTVLEILKEEEERNVYRNKQPQKRRRVPKKPTTPESLPEEDSSDASDDDDEHREQHEHTGKVDEERAVPAVFPVEVKIETRDDDVAHPHAQFSTYVETLTVKIEPPDVDYDKPQTEITIDPLTVKVEPRDDEENKQLRQAGSSTAEYTSNVSANEEFDNTSNIKRKKTASERAKEYRERQKLLKASTSSADHQRGATKQAKLSAKQYRERQQLLKTSESSAGKQQSTSNTKQKKTAAERAKEYRERQKLLKASTSSADHQQRQHTQGESSTSEYTRNVAGNEGFDESYVIKKITEIKMEIQEEGFS